MPEPYEFTLAEAVAKIRNGQLSSVELVGSLIGHIDRLEPSIHAWVTIDRDGVLEAAQKLDRQLQENGPIGLLHGAAIGIKDIIYTNGVETAAGSPLYAGFVPSHDATCVAKLKEAGAIILGKTVSTQFASGDVVGDTRNPWNLEHTPGGSSQGSGAAVGARMCSAALGTQTGGSTLRPAVYCGAVGFKPSYGRISRYGIIPLAWTYDTVGIIARSVEDAAIMLQCMAGYDPNDPSSSEIPVDDYLTGLQASPHPPRIGLIREGFLDRSDDATRHHTESVVETLVKAGAMVEEVRMPKSFASAMAAQQICHEVETAAFHEKYLRQNPEAYAPKIRATIQIGLTIPASYYLQAQRLRRRFRMEVEGLLSEVDVLFTPTTPSPAPRSLTTTGNAAFLAPWTFAGTPSLSIPTGLSEDGLPLGVQLVGSPFQERGLLTVARWCEQTLDIEMFPPLARP